jgi:predicted TIM-barrel fold metal-dependent hydrolase
MDELDVEVQIIYPTLFLREVTMRADISVALNKSYNRWLADRCADSHGRMRWVALIPYHSMPDALDEIRFAKEHGAVGILKRGVEYGGLAASDPYFMPAYELAADLDLAVCIHQGSGFVPTVPFLRTFPGGDADTFPVIAAFSMMLDSDIPKKLPNLRVGFIENGAAWLPHVLGRAGWTWSLAPDKRDRNFSDLNFYVTCEIYEDVPYLMNVTGGDEHLIVGSDYTHGDRSSVLDVHKEMIARTDIDPKSATRITSDNARKFYQL